LYLNADVAPKRARITWPQTVRDLGLRVLSTGRFAPLLVFILLFVALLKAPSEKMPEIIKTLVEQPLVWCFLGWLVAGILLISSIVIFFLMRRMYLDEIDRIRIKRDELQEKLTAQTLQHSRFKGGGKHE
jgi:uncharacterized membrane protein YdjX (TVP38/TMEM64 family)